jgi:hypothetical protein
MGGSGGGSSTTTNLDVTREEVAYWVHVDLIQYIPEQLTTFGTSLARFLHATLLDQWVKDGTSEDRGEAERGEPSNGSSSSSSSGTGRSSEGRRRTGGASRD